MREYILTEQERKIIKMFLETGEKLEGFRLLLHRTRTMKQIREDLNLIENFLRKIEKT